MKWEATGVWKADGGDASMVIDAPNQRAAEAIAAQRGMLVEQCVPAQAVAAHPVAPTPQVNVNVGLMARSTPSDPERAYGLSFSGGFVMYLIGLLLSPALLGIPIIIWGYLARSKIADNRRALKALPFAKTTRPAIAPARKNYSV